jgi:hypothetical protein
MNKTHEWGVLTAVVAGLVLCQVGAATGQEPTSREDSPALAPEEIEQLAPGLKDFSPDAIQSRRTLIRIVATNYLVDPAVTRRMPPEKWQKVLRVCTPGLLPETQAAWAKALRASFVDDAATLAGLSVTDVVALVRALRLLGEKNPESVAARFVEQTSAWRTWADAGDIAQLAGALYGGQGACTKARNLIADRIEQAFLSIPEAIRRAGPQPWRLLGGALASDISESRRAACAKRILEAVQGETAVLTPAEARAWTSAIAEWDRRTGGGLAVEWLRQHKPSWADIPTADLASVGLELHWSAKEEAVALVNELDALWTSRDAREPLTLQECDEISQVWRRVGSTPRADEWLTKGYERTLKTVKTASDLGGIAFRMSESSLIGKGKGLTAFATALEEMARAGKFDDATVSADMMARPLGTAQTRDIVKNAVDDKGRPRLALANIVAHAYARYGGLEAWRSQLDKKLAEKNLDADTRALWLVARSFAAGVSSAAWPNWQPQLRLPWLSQALAAAQSEPVRLLVVEELVRVYRGLKEDRKALSLLQSTGSHRFRNRRRATKQDSGK